MSKKQLLNVKICEIDITDLDGQPIDAVVDRIKSYATNRPGRDLFIRFEYYGFDGGYDIILYERRLETDEEHERRDSAARAAQKKAEDRDREMYERLKKRFETN